MSAKPWGIATLSAAGASAGIAANPALGADVVGEVSVVIEFAAPGDALVEVNTVNASSIPAWGAASITAPDGTVSPWGPSRYEAGEERTYIAFVAGNTCAGLSSVSALASGHASSSSTSPDWTTGTVSYPGARMIVIGCHSSAPTPTATPMPTPISTPTLTSTATSSPTPTANPATGATPTPTVTAATISVGSPGQLASTGALIAGGRL